ncbi:MAG: 50S ribosomal protein L15 [Parvularculales bacterium]
MKLNHISDNAGSRKSRTRAGRGSGSGKGKTAGRGHKGQRSRSGVSLRGFEGGQTPLHMRLPKRGFNNKFSKTFNVITLGRLVRAIESGKLSSDAVITTETLKIAGVIKRFRDGVRIVNGGNLNQALQLKVEGISAGARAVVEKAGGSVTLVDLTTNTVETTEAGKSDK